MEMKNDLAFSPLSADQVDAIKRFEQDFTSRFGKDVYLLAFNEKSAKR